MGEVIHAYRLSLSKDFLRCLWDGFCLLRSCISRRCSNTLCFSGGLCCALAAAVGFLLKSFGVGARVELNYNQYSLSGNKWSNKTCFLEGNFLLLGLQKGQLHYLQRWDADRAFFKLWGWFSFLYFKRTCKNRTLYSVKERDSCLGSQYGRATDDIWKLFDAISGFLGTGKTTLIQKLLEETLKNEKVVLIENEFEEIGIDGGFLKDAGIELRLHLQSLLRHMVTLIWYEYNDRYHRW